MPVGGLFDWLQLGYQSGFSGKQLTKSKTPQGKIPVAFRLNSGGWDRTSDTRLMKPTEPVPNPLPHNTSVDTPMSVARQLPTDPDLTRLAAAWPDMPAHIRATVMALVDTVQKCRETREESEESRHGQDL